MDEEIRMLVTEWPNEFEKSSVQIQDSRSIVDHFSSMEDIFNYSKKT
jgi:hypothetical protein